MIRHTLMTAACTVVLSALMLPSARANEIADPFDAELLAPPPPAPAALESEDQGAEPPFFPGDFSPVTRTPSTLRQVGMKQQELAPHPIDDGVGVMPYQAAPQQPGYVQLGAPLYPSPRPNIPIWTGSTMITNQAFAPHEMLYPHTYRATFPPFYHRVKGCWILTPFGIRSHERWELQGTQVQVKYRSQYPGLLKGHWHPPATTHWHSH
jgi:hypothetical protein